MESNSRPQRTKKITIRVLSAGFSAAWAVMQLPYSKTTLIFKYYGHEVDLHTPLNVLLFFGMIGFGIITGGRFLTNQKGNE